MKFDTLLSWKSRYVLFFNQNQKQSEVFSFHSIEFTFHKLKKAEKTPRYCLLNRKKAQICIKLSENLSGFPFFLACTWFSRQKNAQLFHFSKMKGSKRSNLSSLWTLILIVTNSYCYCKSCFSLSISKNGITERFFASKIKYKLKKMGSHSGFQIIWCISELSFYSEGNGVGSFQLFWACEIWIRYYGNWKLHSVSGFGSVSNFM